MSIIKKTAITALALTTLSVATISAEAGRRERALALGAIGGLVVGAAIASSHNRYYDSHYYDERPIYRGRYASAHVSWCLNRYRSYRPRSNTWISYGGRVRVCYSPYSR
jgi:hypothetical protein